MRVNGETTIFRNAHDGKDGTWYTYATGVSSKRQDGTYANAYMDVRFRKGVEVDNKTRIDIKDAFLSVREFKASDGNIVKKIEIMVLDFTVKEAGEPTGFSALETDDVPF